LKSAPKGFKLGVKAEIEKKNFSICPPQVLIIAELYGLVLAPRLKKGLPSNLRGQFAALGVNVPAFINILNVLAFSISNLGPILQPKNAQSWSPSFLGPDS
jgi:hypothetical protein